MDSDAILRCCLLVERIYQVVFAEAVTDAFPVLTVMVCSQRGSEFTCSYSSYPFSYSYAFISDVLHYFSPEHRERRLSELLPDLHRILFAIAFDK